MKWSAQNLLQQRSSLANSFVTSSVAFWMGTEILVKCNHLNTQEDRQNAIKEIPKRFSLQSFKKSTLHMSWINLPRDHRIKSGGYPGRVSFWPWHYRPNFHSPTNFLGILGVYQICLHMFCVHLEKAFDRFFFSRKTLGSVAGVWT